MRYSSIAIGCVLATAAAACFSERATTSATITGTCTVPANAAGASVVFISGFAFQPVTLHVRPGNSVAWVNCEPTPIPHTSTADAAGWDSGSLAPSAAFVRSFPAAGTFTYHCAIHPSMKATIIVDP